MRLKSRCSRSFSRLASLLKSSSSLSSSRGIIQSLESSLKIIASIDLSRSTRVQTQQPKRELPQLGVVVSTTSGHSLSADAPR